MINEENILVISLYDKYFTIYSYAMCAMTATHVVFIYLFIYLFMRMCSINNVVRKY